MSMSTNGRSRGFVALSAAFLMSGTALAGDVYDDLGCTEFDRYAELTPNDTLTLLTSAHNPEHELGYAIVYAVDESNQAISRNTLIGQQMAIDGIERFEYSVNAVDFRSPLGDGELTDVDGDDIRDLDGAEYDTLPDEILVPRFIGQSNGAMPTVDQVGLFHGQLILIDLNSGADFETTVDFLSYNDNEEVFSGEYTFNCWEKPYLLEISGVYADHFLREFTDQNVNESVSGREAGWFKFEGHVANSSATTISNPGIYGVYVEKVGGYAAADLPFELGSRDGHVLPRSIFGDNSEGSSTEGEGDAVVRRRPGSLLLFPEFNNLEGSLTLYTVTNTSRTEDVKVHFIYYGKYGYSMN